MRALHNAIVAAALTAVTVASPAQAAPPAPCGSAAQIADPAGDGHHKNTDVTAAWLTESAGRLQAVVKVDFAVWEPAHEDSEDAGVALLYGTGGQTRYVRATLLRGTPPVYDHGVWTRASGFASEGATAGEVVPGSGGTVTLDVPGVAAGTVLSQPFVLTYDGGTDPDKHWVDRAPGGNTPDGTEYGADFVAGSCSSATPGTPQDPAASGTPATTTAVDLKAPKRLTGGGRARITGTVTPARAGVAVEIKADKQTRRVTTGANGSFAVSLTLAETTRVRAVAEGRASQTVTIRMYSRVRISVRRLKSGTVAVSGTTSPKLSGRILWLRADAVTPSARTTARNGRFQLRIKHPRRGRYQAVFIPSGARAERSTSNTGVIR